MFSGSSASRFSRSNERVETQLWISSVSQRPGLFHTGRAAPRPARVHVDGAGHTARTRARSEAKQRLSSRNTLDTPGPNRQTCEPVEVCARVFH